MARTVKSIEVGDSPDVLRLADEVRRTGQPHVLRQGAEALAILAPVSTPPRRTPSRRTHRRPSDEEAARSRAGIREAAGAWKALDAEALKAYVRERRAASTRPPVEL